MASTAQAHHLRYSPPLPPDRRNSSNPFPVSSVSPSQNRSRFIFLPGKLQLAFAGGNAGNGIGHGGGYGGRWSNGDSNEGEDSSSKYVWHLGRLLMGQIFRWMVTGDRDIPFKVVLKEMVGVTVSALFVMEEFSTRLMMPMDLVVSGIVAGAILHFAFFNILACFSSFFFCEIAYIISFFFLISLPFLVFLCYVIGRDF